MKVTEAERGADTGRGCVVQAVGCGGAVVTTDVAQTRSPGASVADAAPGAAPFPSTRDADPQAPVESLATRRDKKKNASADGAEGITKGWRRLQFLRWKDAQKIAGPRNSCSHVLSSDPLKNVGNSSRVICYEERPAREGRVKCDSDAEKAAHSYGHVGGREKLVFERSSSSKSCPAQMKTRLSSEAAPQKQQDSLEDEDDREKTTSPAATTVTSGDRTPLAEMLLQPPSTSTSETEPREKAFSETGRVRENPPDVPARISLACKNVANSVSSPATEAWSYPAAGGATAKAGVASQLEPATTPPVAGRRITPAERRSPVSATAAEATGAAATGGSITGAEGPPLPGVVDKPQGEEIDSFATVSARILPPRVATPEASAAAEVGKMTSSCRDPNEDDSMKTKELVSPRCTGEDKGAAHDGGGARGGWNGSGSVNDSDCSWQVVAARRSIENSWSMLGVRSRYSAGDGAAAGSFHVEWDGAPSPAKRVSNAELLAQREQKRNNRLILFVFCIMFLLEIFVNFDSGVIPAILVTLQKRFGIDGAAAGLLGSLPYIGLVASSPFVGRGLTTFSPKWFCFITMVVNLFATGLLGLAVQKWMLFLSRLLIGLSQAGFSIYAPVWVDQFAPAEKLTLWMGLAQGGVVVGTMLGCILAGTFDSASAGETNDSGWRYALLIQAVGLFVLLVVWLLLPRRFVDINMQQTKSAEARAGAASETPPSRDATAGGKQEEEEEQATGVEGAPEYPQKADATTTSSIFGTSSSRAIVEQNKKQQPSQQEQQQQPRDTVVVISGSSEGLQRDVELAGGVPKTEGEEGGEEEVAAAAAESNAGGAAAVADIRNSGRRHSTAGTGKTGRERLREDATGRDKEEPGEERRWSAFVGMAPAALFGRKGNKRPSTAAGGLTLPPQGAAAAATYRPSSKALSEGEEPATSNGRKTPNLRPSQATRGVQSGDAAASSTEGLPQFRRTFISNLLPLDFIATSPTFARRSSQLHPGPAPGAAAAAAAGVASSGASSCSSSSSIGSPRKEQPRSGGGRGSGTVLVVHRRSSSLLGTTGGGGGTRAGSAAQRKKPHRKEGSSIDQLRPCAGGEGVGTGEELTLPAATGDTERGPTAAVSDVSRAPGDDVSRNSASAAPLQPPQQQQRGHFLLGLVARPTTARAAAPVAAAAERKRASTAVSARKTSPKTAAGDSNAVAAAAASLEGAAAVKDVIPGSAASRSSSKPSRRGSGIEATSPVDPAGVEGADLEAAASASHLLSSSQCCEASVAALPSGLAAVGTGVGGDSRAAAGGGGEAADAVCGDRGESGSSGRSVGIVTVESEQQQHGDKADVSGEEEAPAAAAADRCRRGSAAADATDTPAASAAHGGLVVGGGGLAGAAPGGGLNEVQYQRIFMTPHASTLAFEAFNWAAGVADPLLLVRDNGRHHSVGGGAAAGGNGTTPGGAGLQAGVPVADGAHPVALHGARRRRSTTGVSAAFIRSAARVSTAAAVTAAVPRKAAPTESAEAATVAEDESAVVGGVAEAAAASLGERLAAKKTSQKVIEEKEEEQSNISKQEKLPGAGGKATAGAETPEQRQSVGFEDGHVRGRENVEAAAAAAAPREARGEQQLQEKISAVLTEASATTLPGEPRTFGVWQSTCMLFSSPLYICVTISLCALFFEVTAIQFWSISYFQQELQVPKGQVLVAFNVTAATGPILGVLAGGWFIDFVGGYKTEKGMMKTLLILGSWATICLVLGTFACWVPSFTATIVFIWGILFFGGGILPAATGIVIASVPLEVRAFGSGFCMMIYNVFGYVLGTAVPGAVVQAAGLAWGMRMVFLWSIFGVGGLFSAAFVVWRLRIRPSYYICTYGVDGQEEAEPITTSEDFRNNSGLCNGGTSVAAADGTNPPANAGETSGPTEAPGCVAP